MIFHVFLEINIEYELLIKKLHPIYFFKPFKKLVRADIHFVFERNLNHIFRFHCFQQNNENLLIKIEQKQVCLTLFAIIKYN